MPDPSHNVMTKLELRREIRRRKGLLVSSATDLYAERAYDLVVSTESFQEAGVVLLYAALPDEVPTQRLLEAAEGKTILLPRVVGDNLEIRLYTTPADLVESPDYHILEPSGPLFTDYAAIDLAIIPGMAFDALGHRLGRGKGFYDRFLALPACRRLKTIGLCFDFQLIEDLPTEPHDLPVGSVIVVPHSTTEQ